MLLAQHQLSLDQPVRRVLLVLKVRPVLLVLKVRLAPRVQRVQPAPQEALEILAQQDRKV